MIVDTIDKFIAVISTAEGTDFSIIKPYLENAENSLKLNYFGTSLHDYVTANQAEAVSVAYIRTLCNMAYNEAIPFVDLIETPNGFAVVSNQNQAPASKERVERLINRTEVSFYNELDKLIDIIIIDAALRTKWTEYSNFTQLTNCIFLNGSDFARYHECDGPAMQVLNSFRSDILAIQNTIIAKEISMDLMNEILSQIRTNSLTASNKLIVPLLKNMISQFIAGNLDVSKKVMTNIVYIIESDLDNFAKYKNSNEYLAKQSPIYENGEDDPCYFFSL